MPNDKLKVWVWVIAVVLIAGLGWYSYGMQQAKNAAILAMQATSGGVAVAPEAPANSTAETSEKVAVDTSDSALDADMSAMDTEMSVLDLDVASADKGMNDQPIAQGE